MEYFCRRVRPVPEDVWHTVEESSPGRAANEYQVRYDRYHNYSIVDKNEAEHTEQIVYFALIEVKDAEQDYGSFISRYFYSRIWRRAGVKVPDKQTVGEKLVDLADVLGYDGSPDELLSPGWDCEEEEWK